MAAAPVRQFGIPTVESGCEIDQGPRRTMEDTQVVIDAVSAACGIPTACAFYSINDGHGGARVAEMAKVCEFIPFFYDKRALY